MDTNEPFPMKPEGDNLFDRVVFILTFYTVYSDRIPEIRHIACGELKDSEKRHIQSGVLDAMTIAVEQIDIKRGFSPNLG